MKKNCSALFNMVNQKDSFKEKKASSKNACNIFSALFVLIFAWKNFRATSELKNVQMRNGGNIYAVC